MKRLFSAAMNLMLLTVLPVAPQSGAQAGSGIIWQDHLTPQSLIDVGNYHTVAVRANGTAAAGENSRGQYSLEGWTDIIAVSAGYQRRGKLHARPACGLLGPGKGI